MYFKIAVESYNSWSFQVIYKCKGHCTKAMCILSYVRDNAHVYINMFIKKLEWSQLLILLHFRTIEIRYRYMFVHVDYAYIDWWNNVENIVA